MNTEYLLQHYIIVAELDTTACSSALSPNNSLLHFKNVGLPLEELEDNGPKNMLSKIRRTL